MSYSFNTNELRAFNLDLSIILNDLSINSNLTKQLNPEPMKPINPDQERATNKAFIVVLLLLSIAQILNIIINTL